MNLNIQGCGKRIQFWECSQYVTSYQSLKLWHICIYGIYKSNLSSKLACHKRLNISHVNCTSFSYITESYATINPLYKISYQSYTTIYLQKGTTPLLNIIYQIDIYKISKYSKHGCKNRYIYIQLSFQTCNGFLSLPPKVKLIGHFFAFYDIL